MKYFPASRLNFLEEGDSLQLEIEPAAKRRLRLLNMAICLAVTLFLFLVWGRAILPEIQRYFRGQAVDSDFYLNFGLFFFYWLLVFFFGGFGIWIFFHKEGLNVDSQRLQIKRTMLGLGPNRKYPLNEIQNFRVVPLSALRVKALVFDFSGNGGSEVKFARYLDCEDAELLMNKVGKYLTK